MTATIRPFLMFEGKAEEAMTCYVSLFPDSEILECRRFASREPGAEGSVMRGRFRIGDQTVMCFDSPVKHAFGFTPAISLFVDVASREQFDRACDALIDGGTFLMPPGEYGFSRRFAWVSDRYGVSWQLNLA